jgi:hypothetical protein
MSIEASHLRRPNTAVAAAMCLTFVLSIIHPSLGANANPLVSERPSCDAVVLPAQVVGDTSQGDQSAHETSSGETGSATEALGGRWRALPPSPFAAIGAASAWTGDRMLVVDGVSRRAATYDPASNAWTLAARPPKSFLPGSPSVWTGSAMIIFGQAEGGAFGLAYDPVNDEWYETSDPPLASVGDAVAWGDLVVVATSGLSVAAYDPVEDCWTPLPSISGHARLAALHSADHMLLAVTIDQGGSIPPVVSAFDAIGGRWIASEPGPSVYLGAEHGLWADERLVFLSGVPNEGVRIWNAAFDPYANAWHTLETECDISTRQAVWTGTLIINGYWRRAYDPLRDRCHRLPRSGDRTRRDGATVWTGQVLIHWSGGQGEELRALPDGRMYRPPETSTSPE